MKYTIISLLLVFASCAQQTGPTIEDLAEQYGNLTDEETGLLDPDRSRAFITSARAYAESGDAQASEWLFKAGEVAQGIQDNEEALALYQGILEDFPEGDRAADATFMIAFTYDENFRNMAKAREYYELFLEKYPEDDFADDAQILLNMLGE